MPHEALLMDLDGTLYPYEPCHQAGKDAAHQTAEELGYDMDEDEFHRFYRTGRRAVKRELAGTGPSHERYLYFKRAIELHTGSHHARHAVELSESYWNGHLECMDPFDGVIDTLDALGEAGIQMAVTTDLTTRIQLRKIARLGIEDRIDFLMTSEETGRDKPAAAMFAVPLAKLGVPPRDAVMVGDSITSDIEGGNSIGMMTVLFNSDEEPDDVPWEQPDHRIDSFKDIIDIMEVETSA